MTKKIDPIKKMAELLKSGATMLAETCPVEGCNLPLFRLPSGEVVCPVHGKVYVVKSEEEVRSIEEELTITNVLDRIEKRVLENLSYLVEGGMNSRELIEWLEVLERIRRIKNMLKKTS